MPDHIIKKYYFKMLEIYIGNVFPNLHFSWYPFFQKQLICIDILLLKPTFCYILKLLVYKEE